MKRKLIFGLIAILAIGLAVVGCSNSNGSPGTDPIGFDALKPWAPSTIPDPAGYKDFPKGAPAKIDGEDNPARDGLLGYTAFFAGVGDAGYILEGDNDGEYIVTVNTNPGGVSLVSFQDNDPQYKTGFYLSLELPTATEAAPRKPIGMVALPSKGMQDNGADWSLAQYVNLDTAENPIKDDVYLAGRVDFVWTNDSNPWPLRTICLRIKWHDDEEAGVEYVFKVRKILIPENDNLDAPAYPVQVWPYDPIPAPTTGWKDFPAASITGAFVETGAGVGTITVTPGSEGYSITIPTYANGHTDITFPASNGSVFIDGYYLSLALPENSTAALRPYRVYAYPSSYWAGAIDYEPAIGYYVGGNVDMKWTNDGEVPNTDPLDKITLQFYWHADEPEGGTYTFTLKKLKVTDDDYVPPDPNEMTAWTPPAAPAASDWINFPPSPTISASSPSGATIEANGSGGYTVTTKTVAPASEWAHTEITLSSAGFKFKGGYCLSLTLPNQTKDDTNKVKRVYVVPDSVWSYAVDLSKTNCWIQGTFDCNYSHEEFTAGAGTIVLSIYWHEGTTDGQNYTFTINSIKVKEEYVLTYDDLVPEAGSTIAAPTSWKAFPGTEAMEATYYPFATATSNVTNTVTITPTAGARTLVNLHGTSFTYQKGIYVSLTLPTDSAKPLRIIAAPSKNKNANGDGLYPDNQWGYLSDTQASAGKFIGGKADFKWEDDTSSSYTFEGIILDFYWDGDEPNTSYTFTINTIEVKE